jgi:N-acylneuraminate cytidylyltransferase
VAALITARGGSKGLPGKNIRPLAGKPLIAHTIDTARAALLVDAVYLSSDDAEIIAVARTHGCDVPFTRPVHLASDEATSLDVVCDALERLPPHDVWVLLQPTSPLRTAADIDAVLEPVVAGRAPSCVAVRAAEEHPWLTFTASEEGRLRPFCALPGGASLRRQDLPPAFLINGAAYAFTPEGLIKDQAFVTENSAFHVMPPERSIDIDTLKDFEAAEKILMRPETRS